MGDGLKSAYERAMERLKEKGMEPAGETTLTDEQKHEIGEIRREFDAKVAELNIMMQSDIKKSQTDEEGEGSVPVADIEARIASEKASLMGKMEKRVEAVRRRSKESG
ncbi:MAG: hypothetical protein O6916_04505 [bacterium]|jgi:hypothetical protein|nr:hypothetical protein [bacterium]MCZ6701372.1 hypothetical protein [bacterium]MDV2479189.1 hypothetical protein [bacterium]